MHLQKYITYHVSVHVHMNFVRPEAALINHLADNVALNKRLFSFWGPSSLSVDIALIKDKFLSECIRVVFTNSCID